MSKKKAKVRSEADVEEGDEEDDEDKIDLDKIDLDDVPLYNRGHMILTDGKQDLEDAALPKKRRGRKPKKAHPPTTSPSVTSMLNFCFININFLTFFLNKQSCICIENS